MTVPESRLLTEGQRKLVGFAVALFALLASVAMLLSAIWALAWLVGRFAGVLLPVALAGVVALILRPAVELVEQRLHQRRLTAVIVLYGLFLLAAGGLSLLVLPPLVRQLQDFISYLPSFLERVESYAQQHYPDWIVLKEHYLGKASAQNPPAALSQEVQELAARALPSLRAAGQGALAVFAFFAAIAVIPIYLFVFLLSRNEPASKLADHLPFLSPDVRADVVFLVQEFVGIVVSFFRGQILIGLIMGVMLALGFSLAGLKFGLVIGLALGILNIVPYLGTIVGLAVALPLAYFQPDGGWALVGLVLLVKIVVQGIESWFLTPKIMGDRTGLPPAVIIFAIFFWGTALGGMLGLVFAIPLTAFFVTAWRLARRKYFRAP
jgi:predicted PurR-regulated permease PerM